MSLDYDLQREKKKKCIALISYVVIIFGLIVMVCISADTGSLKVSFPDLLKGLFLEYNEDVYTIYDYQKDVRKLLEERKDKCIIIVGGSGLYQRAALYDYNLLEDDNNQNEFENYSNEELYKKLYSSSNHSRRNIWSKTFINS